MVLNSFLIFFLNKLKYYEMSRTEIQYIHEK